MEAILESNKSLWRRTGNMALVVIGAISIFLASFEQVNLYVFPSLIRLILDYLFTFFYYSIGISNKYGSTRDCRLSFSVSYHT